jgi:hypothetical protein
MRKVFLVMLLLPVLAWAAQSPFDGTWKIDLSKIQFPEKPDTWVLQNGSYQCSTCVPKINVKADGTDQPTPGTKYTDTLAVKVLDDKTVEMTSKKGGKVTETEKNTVSVDGKTITSEFTEYPETSKQPVTGKIMLTRTAAGPAGSHAFSGSWRTQKADAVSDNGLTLTFKSTADGLTTSSPTGEGYDAKFDGKEYPIKGDVAGSTVTLTKVNDHSIDETIKRDGKIVAVNHMTVSADGKMITTKSEDKEHGTTTTWTATKQ